MSIGVQSRTEIFDAAGRVALANANFFFLITATAAINVQLNKIGSPEQFSGVIAGLKVQRRRGWENAFLSGGVPGASVTFFYGYMDVKEDDTAFNQQIAVIAGTVAVAILPGSTFTDTADTTQASGTQTAISANAARRRITIGVLSSAAEGVRVSFTGGANTRGVEIQPGTFVEFQTTAALVVRNANIGGSGGNSVWYAEEEA